MQSIKTWCPVFTGFYNTIWEIDDDSVLCNLNEDYDHEVKYDDVEWDHRGFMIATSEQFVTTLEPILKKMFPSIRKVIYQELRSPKEYNFYTDAIDIEVKATKGLYKEIRAYLKLRSKDWEKYLSDRYTDRSGFWSSYPNDPESWEHDTKNYTELDSHYLGSILQFACEDNEDCEELSLYSDVTENVYADEYATYKGQECKICMDQHTKNKYGVCNDCIEDPHYKEFLIKAKDQDALIYTPPLPGIDVKSKDMEYTHT